MAAGLSCCGQGRDHSEALDGLPKIFLWAWERPTDLRFLRKPDAIGVAYLAASILLAADQVEVRPRLQPFLLLDGIVVAAVVRIETDPERPPVLDTRQADQTVEAILELADRPDASLIQIDFDALRSQRAFYADLLSGLRRRMPPDKPLSITALASWCMGDPWIEDLPIDEAVPMLFQMGPDGPSIQRRLDAGADFRLPVCRQSVGLSLDEPEAWRFHRRRAYLFNPGDWSEQKIRDAVQSIESGRR